MKKLLSQQRGFSLSDLIMTVVIIGVLAAIAIPNYQSHVLKTQRRATIAEVYELITEQERLYSQDGNYSATTITSNSGRHQIALTVPTSGQYSIAITALGAQLSDAGCTSLTIDSYGNRTPASCW